MPFEFDPKKSALAKADPNRGIDFEEAQELWADPDRIELPIIGHGEPRFQVLATMGSKHWSVIITYRGPNTRIISIRRMRNDEKEAYERRRQAGL